MSGRIQIWPSLINSAIVTIGATLIALVLASPAAYGLSRMRHLRSARAVYLSAFVLRGVPPVALVIPYYLIFSRLRMLDSRFGLIIALVPLALPYCIWTLRVFFDAVPEEVEEAASVDGANVWRRFRSITLPIAIPGIAATGVLAALLVFVDYIIVVTLAGPSTMTFPVYVTTFQQDHLTLIGPLAAAAVVGTLPMIVMYTYSQKYMQRLGMSGIH